VANIWAGTNPSAPALNRDAQPLNHFTLTQQAPDFQTRPYPHGGLVSPRQGIHCGGELQVASHPPLRRWVRYGNRDRIRLRLEPSRTLKRCRLTELPEKDSACFLLSFPPLTLPLSSKPFARAGFLYVKPLFLDLFRRTTRYTRACAWRRYFAGVRECLSSRSGYDCARRAPTRDASFETLSTRLPRYMHNICLCRTLRDVRRCPQLVGDRPCGSPQPSRPRGLQSSGVCLYRRASNILALRLCGLIPDQKWPIGHVAFPCRRPL